jgi:Ca-activated chloride channel family protein
MALLLSLLLVIQERWPNNALYRFFAFTPVSAQVARWRQRLQRLLRRP